MGSAKLVRQAQPMMKQLRAEIWPRIIASGTAPGQRLEMAERPLKASQGPRLGVGGVYFLVRHMLRGKYTLRLVETML